MPAASPLNIVQTAQFSRLRHRLHELDSSLKIVPAALLHLESTAPSEGLDHHVGASVNALQNPWWNKQGALRGSRQLISEARRRLIALLLVDGMAAFENYVVDLIYAHIAVRPNRPVTAQWTDEKGNKKRPKFSVHQHLVPPFHPKGSRFECCANAAKEWSLKVPASARMTAFPSTIKGRGDLSTALPFRIFEYARTARNAVAHGDSVVSQELTQASQHSNLRAEESQLSARAKDVPELPRFNTGDAVHIEPEHLVMLFTALRRSAAEYDKMFLASLRQCEKVEYLMTTFVAYPTTIRKSNQASRDLTALARKYLGLKKVTEREIVGCMRSHPQARSIRALYSLCA